MLIQALCDYAEQQMTEQLPEGWQKQEIHFRIVLTPDGEIKNIVDIRRTETFFDKKGKEKIKLVPEKILLPVRTQKTSIDSNLIEHRPLYIFGLNYENNGFTPQDKTNKAQNSHNAFIKYNLDFFTDLNSEICIAYKKFLENWNPAQMQNHPALLKLGKDYKNSYFGFCLEGMRDKLEEDVQFQEKYQQYVQNQNSIAPAQEELVMCGILGENLPIARIHDKIKFPGGNSVGCALVGMNAESFESYGKSQSYNSNVSEQAMKQYTQAMNALLSDRNHYKIIGDMVVIYFAMKTDDSQECAWFGSQFEDMPDFWKDTEDDIKEINLDLDKSFKQAQKGFASQDIDENAKFYVVGMTPNSSRICQKFIWRDKFGNVIQNLKQHQEDLHISPEYTKSISFSRIAKELISPKSSNEKVPPPLMTSVMLSAMQGTRYPETLLSAVIRRVKTDSDEENNHFIKLNAVRAGIIKACLNRKTRLSKQKEEITMAWDNSNQNPAYLCGSLFAVYEKIQKEASGDLNRTIKDSYFSSACARPSAIMPKLDKLSNYHLKKLSQGNQIYYQKLISQIMNNLESSGFPQTLDMDNQGRFIIGYYQMNQHLYTKKSNQEEG